MKILIDMNLSPIWVKTFEEEEMEALHWSKAGKYDAPDQEIMTYARYNNYVVFTHDLDFGDILAATGADSPSVIQIRSEDTTPQAIQDVLIPAIRRFQSYLKQGALVTIDPNKSRVRISPLKTEE